MGADSVVEEVMVVVDMEEVMVVVETVVEVARNPLDKLDDEYLYVLGKL